MAEIIIRVPGFHPHSTDLRNPTPLELQVDGNNST